MQVEEHNHCFMHFFGVKTLSGTLWGTAFNENGKRVAGLGPPFEGRLARARYRCGAPDAGALARAVLNRDPTEPAASEAAAPSPATHAILTVLKAGEACFRRFVDKNSVGYT